MSSTSISRSTSRSLALVRSRSQKYPALPRTIHSSSNTKGAAGSTSSHPEEDDTYYPPEGFTAPIWRNFLIGGIAAFGIYRVSNLYAEPSPSRASSSGRSAPSNDSSEDDEDKRPFITRYLEYYTIKPDVYKDRELKYLDLTREKAEHKLFTQNCDRPPVHRLRFPSTFENASPHSIPVGGTTDLSDLVVKGANE